MMCSPPMPSTVSWNPSRWSRQVPEASSAASRSSTDIFSAFAGSCHASSIAHATSSRRRASAGSSASASFRDSPRSRWAICRQQRARTSSSDIEASASFEQMPAFFQCSISVARSNFASLMSVPRPAMLVAIMTAPSPPAPCTMSASRSCCFALSTSWGMRWALVSMRLSISLRSTLVVPTSTGRPTSQERRTSSTIASHLSPSFK